MDPLERLERLDRVLEFLVEESFTAPILVEGPRDEAALRTLGVEGTILVYNRMGGIVDVADHVRAYQRIILLLDWDRKGGHLTRLIRQQLEGSVQLETRPRAELAHVSLVRCVEDLPSARKNLRARAGERRKHDEG